MLVVGSIGIHEFGDGVKYISLGKAEKGEK